jgi:cell volume regulation protein A
VAAARLSSKLGLPSLLLFLVLGIVVGELGLPFTDAALAHDLGFAALVIILAEGGFTTRWSEIKGALPPALLLASIGVVIQIALMALFGYYVLGMGIFTAILLGAICSPTDSAAVFSVLRKVPLPAKVRAILEAESGFNDAPIVLLVAVATNWAVYGMHDDPWALAATALLELLGGFALGALVGFAGAWVMHRIALPSSGLYPLAALGWAVLGYGFATWFPSLFHEWLPWLPEHFSGFAAVYVAAVVLGNSRLPHRNATRGFVEGVGWVAQIGLFVMLGMMVDLERISWAAIFTGAAFGAFLTFIARPFAVTMCTVWFKIPLRVQMFVSWAGLRGAVPIIMALVPWAENAPEAAFLFDTTFCFVIIYTILQAPTLGFIARMLKISKGEEPTDLEIEFAPLDTIKADMMEVSVEPGSKLHGVSLREIRMPKGSVISLIVRDGEPFTPSADERIRIGDSLLIVTRAEDRQTIERRLKALSDHGRLAKWKDDQR